MTYIEKFIVFIVRYIKTWQMLLLHLDSFVKIPLAERKRVYLPPIVFLFVSLTIFSFLLDVSGHLFLLAIDPEMPTANKWLSWPDQSILLPSLVEITIQAFLWYVILYRWLGHSLRIVTPTPYRRIFNELLYIESPVSVIGTTLNLLGWLIFFGLTIVLILLAVKLPLDDLPDFLSTICLVVLVIVELLIALAFFLLPGWFLIAFYNTVLAVNILAISRRRAIKLCLLFSLVSSIPVRLYSVSVKFMTPFQLSDVEIQAVQEMRAIANIESEYYQKNNTSIPVDQLKSYTSTFLPDSLWTLMHKQSLERVNKLQGTVFNGYRFYIQHGRRGGYIQALPIAYGDHTRRSFVSDLFAWQIVAGDHNGGSATFSDKILILLGDSAD